MHGSGITVTKLNLLWVQFTPGSAGRAMLICCTTSDAVGDWLELTEPKQFAQKWFCPSVDDQHMNVEPQTPYNVSWYTRNPIFTRGDDLSLDEARTHLLNDKVANQHYQDNKLIAEVWHKSYIPAWAKNEKIITICNDNDSISWLLNRRKKVFYKWFDKEVHLIKYIPKYAPIRDHRKLYKPVQYIYPYDDADEFVKQHLAQEDIQNGPGLNVDLSAIINGDLEPVWDKVDAYLGKPVDRKWCNTFIDTWRQRWV